MRVFVENVKEIDSFQGKYKLPKLTRANLKSPETIEELAEFYCLKSTEIPAQYCFVGTAYTVLRSTQFSCLVKLFESR